MATRSRGGATQTVAPKVPRCGCKPSKKTGECCQSASCGCRAAARACTSKCGCFGNTGGRHPCANEHTRAGAADAGAAAAAAGAAGHRPNDRRRPFGGAGFSLGSGRGDGDRHGGGEADVGGGAAGTGGAAACPLCGRTVPAANLPMHAARCGLPAHSAQRGSTLPGPADAAQSERTFMRVQQESEYEAGLRADEEKAFADQQRKQDVDAAARRQRRDAERRERELEMARRRLGLPPPQDTAEPTARVAIRLLCGRRVSRRFRASSGLQSLFDFADVSSSAKPAGEAAAFVLRSHYPQATFTRPSTVAAAGGGAGHESLQSLGLCPDATLFAEEMEMACTRDDQKDATGSANAIQAAGTGAEQGAVGMKRSAASAAVSASATAHGFSAQGPSKRAVPPLPGNVVELLSSDDEDQDKNEDDSSSASAFTSAADGGLSSTWTCRMVRAITISVRLSRVQPRRFAFTNNGSHRDACMAACLAGWLAGWLNSVRMQATLLLLIALR
jgi:hypothetical protein